MTCPDCDARYEIPPDMAARLPARLRCARCGAEWHQDAPVTQAPEPAFLPETTPEPVLEMVPQAVPEPAPEPALDLAPAETVEIPPSPAVSAPPFAVEAVPFEPVPPVAARRIAVSPKPETTRLLWFASIGILVGLIALAIGFRGAIIHIWPPSLRLYRGLGLGH